MHIPDGFLSTPVWAGLAALSAPSVGSLARKAQNGLEDGRVPLMGVMGAFIFAAQMVNFPVGVGTSGHLVGSALLAATLGPAPAVVVMTAILTIQALVFQDGGLLALGANVFNMALAGVLAGYLPFRLLAGTRARLAGLFLGGFLSVMVTGFLCLGELALSGVRMPSQALVLALLVFSITGALEGAISVAVLSALGRMNPRWLQKPADGTAGGGRRVLVFLGLCALVLASCGFFVASALPDGLERITGMIGVSVPDYRPEAADGSWIRRAGGGVFGLALTTLACLALGRWINRWRRA